MANTALCIAAHGKYNVTTVFQIQNTSSVHLNTQFKPMYMKHTHTQSVGTGREYNLDGVIGRTVGVGHGGGWVWGEGVHVLMWHSMPSSEGCVSIETHTHFDSRSPQQPG